MAYVIENIRDHVVHVDGVPINPGDHLVVRHMTGPISKALDVGDLCLVEEPRDEHPDFDAVDSSYVDVAQ